MDVVLQRHCAKYVYVIPDGLRELMSDISREVLRSQPEHIYTFIADYLDALMITRENARVAARVVESITEIGITIADLLIRTGMSREEADRLVTIIQRAFRKHLTDKVATQHTSEVVEEANLVTEILDEADIDPEQAEHAAIIIQNAYRNFKMRKEREQDLLRGMVDWRVAARSTMRLYRKTGVAYEEANRAATLIKAAYKGYYTRRVMKRLLEESERLSAEERGSLEGEDVYHYVSYWDQTEEDSYDHQDSDHKDIESEEGPSVDLVSTQFEDSEKAAVADIIDNLLKRAIPSSLSSSQMESNLITPIAKSSLLHPSAQIDAKVEPAEDQSCVETAPHHDKEDKTAKVPTHTAEELQHEEVPQLEKGGKPKQEALLPEPEKANTAEPENSDVPASQADETQPPAHVTEPEANTTELQTAEDTAEYSMTIELLKAPMDETPADASGPETDKSDYTDTTGNTSDAPATTTETDVSTNPEDTTDQSDA